ncbi:aminoacyl-tRNA hydrolase [Candidatus Gottesmanbacteria bacterium]|nr:aminoacyl-tRNA hydrolase [Candidatus Gottesmanbacteria bacterium]
MRLIVGLGNPKEKFQYTRHNIGFMVVEKFVKELLPLSRTLSAWKKEEKLAAEVCKIDDLIVVKPQTYMNLTGLSVRRLVDFYKIATSDIWVVHDDIDLPLGKVRIRCGGASAGHHGVDSIIRELKTADFIRFRLGIGKGKLDIFHTADKNLHRREIKRYVLSPFRVGEGGEVKNLVKKAAKALELAVDKGIQKAMNRFN